MPIADYLNRRHTNNAPEAFAQLLRQLLQAYEEGNTLLETKLSPDVQSALQEAGLLGTQAVVVEQQQRYWLNVNHHAEQELSHALRTKARAPKSFTPLPPPPPELNPLQQQAWQHALRHRFTIINGGPGTGKTYTLAHIVRTALQEQPNLRIARTAPTGKAAKRMSQSLNQSLKADADRLSLEPAQTLHRLLGINADRGARYHAHNPLPYDLVIVDEASMLSLPLAHDLLQALAPESALILLGDAQQLAAVDAGAVLHDLSTSPELQSCLITLQDSQRFSENSIIGQLARHVSDPEAFLTCVQQPHPQLHHYPQHHSITQLAQPYQPYFKALQQQQNFSTLMPLFDQYRILSTTHHGDMGIKNINQQLEQWHKALCHLPSHLSYFHGQPLMMTANDYGLGVFNGDIGLCLEIDGELFFHLEDHEPIPINHLNPQQCQSAYALTVHKSQGSEYEHVALFLPDDEHLSRELLYTGITRAKSRLSLYANESALRRACQHVTQRQTGVLRDH